MLKKGQSRLTLWWLINLFFVGIVVISLIYFLGQQALDSGLEKKMLAKDIALTLNAVYASPNDLIYAYAENDFPFNVSFEANSVNVFDSSPQQLNSQKYDFIADNYFKFIYTNVRSISISREGEQVTIIPLAFKKTRNVLRPFSTIKTEVLLNE